MKPTDFKIKPFRLLFQVILAAIFGGCAHYDGGRLFHTEGCITCHRFKGSGGGMGPDLTAITALKSDSAIYNYLQNPKKYNPHARMPSFANLSRSKRNAIIAYLKK